MKAIWAWVQEDGIVLSGLMDLNHLSELVVFNTLEERFKKGAVYYYAAPNL